MGCKPCRLKAICSLDIRSGKAQYKLGLYSVSVTEGKFYYLEVVLVAQYADVGHESAPNRVQFGSGPIPGRHPVLGGGIGGLRQIGAEPTL